MRMNRKAGCEFVFHRNGRPVKDFRAGWKLASEKAKVTGRIFHDFRRTAVRNMVRAGIPEQVAMQISGHKTRSIFDKYPIVNDDDLKQAAQKKQHLLDRYNSATLNQTVKEPTR